MNQEDRFLKAFQEGHKCGFCEKENAHIMRIILIPLIQRHAETHHISGYVVAHKSVDCIEEELDED